MKTEEIESSIDLASFISDCVVEQVSSEADELCLHLNHSGQQYEAYLSVKDFDLLQKDGDVIYEV